MQAVSIDNVRHYDWGEGNDGWHLLQSESLSIIQERVPPGGAETRHYHRRAEQFFFVLSGVVTIEVNGELQELATQQGLHVPAGALHGLSNRGQTDCWFIVVSTPPSHGDRVPAS